VAAANLVREQPLFRISFYSVSFRLSIEKGEPHAASFFLNKPKAQLFIPQDARSEIVTVTK
jgi:hypothetical protein